MKIGQYESAQNEGIHEDAQIRVIENMPYFIIKKYKNSIAFLQTQLHQSAHAVKVPFEVIRPPGSRLNTFAQSFYSKKTYERVFQQWVIDWREEHAEALAQGKPGLARWRAFSGNLVFYQRSFASTYVSPRAHAD